MPSSRSWFSPASSSKLDSSNVNHELPRWHSPARMAASIIPPPIVQSLYLSPPRPAHTSVPKEQPSPLQDRQSEIEADLQWLLDAQAEGLVRGLHEGAPDDQTSTGSTTPTTQSVRSAVAERRNTRPARKKPGLRAVRKGIYNSITALSTVKHNELQALDADVRDKEDTLAQIDEWQQKRTGLQKAARRADDSEDTVRAQRLQQEADVLQDEISQVELQLAEMKARHRKLLRQVAVVENSVQAKLASYTSSLSMLEADVHKFLSLQPANDDVRPGSKHGGKESMWELPPQRRTLELAREHYTLDHEALSCQRLAVEHERTALDEGAAMWKDVVAHVTDFEKRLRAEMAHLSSSPHHSAWDDSPPPTSSPEHENSRRLKELLAHLSTVLDHLLAQYEVAETRDWKLLLAAVGAELDALRQGKDILENVLGQTPQEDLVDTQETPPSNSTSLEADTGGEEIHELEKSFETARPAMPQRTVSSEESETDDPDPELLFSRQGLGS